MTYEVLPCAGRSQSEMVYVILRDGVPLGDGFDPLVFRSEHRAWEKVRQLERRSTPRREPFVDFAGTDTAQLRMFKP